MNAAAKNNSIVRAKRANDDWLNKKKFLQNVWSVERAIFDQKLLGEPMVKYSQKIKLSEG